MALCLYVYVARFSSRLIGGIAALFPGITGALYYATEARPYGVVLGLSALSLLLWHFASSRRSLAAAVGLTLTLALALSTHYYALLAMVPIAAGEVTRLVSQRRVNWPVWISLISAMSVWTFYIPLIRAARSYSPYFWARADMRAFIEALRNLFGPAILCILVVQFIICLHLLRNRDVHFRPIEQSGPPLPIIVAVVAFSTLPIIGFILAKTVTGAFRGPLCTAGCVGSKRDTRFGGASGFKRSRSQCNTHPNCYFCEFYFLRNERLSS